MLACWFDANGNIMSMDLPDKKESFDMSDRLMADLIQKEVDLGIPMNRIIIGEMQIALFFSFIV